ncbi:MAG: hypothetical protein LBB48_07950 [Treponema sp.]|nr:hypothetical protein [Treponema sp.]
MCTVAEEFAGADFNKKRLEQRFERTVETVSKEPYSAAAISLTKGEIPRARCVAAIRRTEGRPSVLAAQVAAMEDRALSCRSETRKERERNRGKVNVLILRHSVIAVFIMNPAYRGRIRPELPWKILFEGGGKFLTGRIRLNG